MFRSEHQVGHNVNYELRIHGAAMWLCSLEQVEGEQSDSSLATAR